MRSRFRTIEISDPRFESEGLRQVTVKSRSLAGRGDLTVFRPPGVTGPLDLVILLHGVYGSHWAWSAKGGAHRTALRLMQAGEIPPLVIAMPSDGLWGDGSGYVPHAHVDFEKWIVEDVPAAAELAAGPLKPGFFISGLSMGGFGALRLGAKYHAVCHGISAHSSITEFEQMANFVEEDLYFYKTDASNQSAAQTLLQQRENLPPLRFDCGTEDLLLQANRELSQFLHKHAIRHQYQEFPGGHEWAYWETHLAESLRFFGQNILPA